MSKQAKSRKKKICDAILGVILGLAVLLTVLLFVGRALNKPIFIFGKSFAWIITQSMEDTIPAQSYILIEEATANDVEIGDVIIFKSENPALNGGYNTHRVIAINESRTVFTTKGDNNPADDGQYSAKAENIVGKFVRVLPVMTALMRFFSSPVGFTVLILLLVALTVAVFLPDVLKARREKAENARKMDEEEKQKLIAQEVERLKNENNNKPE